MLRRMARLVDPETRLQVLQRKECAMMHHIRRCCGPWCAALLVGALVSCGHDAPTRPEITPEALAHQLDSLATASLRAGNTQGAAALSQAALAVRNGVATSDIAIAEGSTTEQYHALAVRLDPGTSIDIPGLPGTGTYPIPSMWGLVAWQSDLPAGRVIAVSALADSATLDTIGVVQTETGPEIQVPTGAGFMIDAGKLHLVAVHGTAVLSPLRAQGQCANPSQRIVVSNGTLAASTTSLPPLTCTQWSFAGHFDITFQRANATHPLVAEPGAPTSTFTMSRQTVNGIRLAP